LKIVIAANKRIVAEKKKGADKSGIGIKIIGTACFSSTIENKILNYQLSKTVLSATVIIGMIKQIDDIGTMINGLMGQLEEECRFTIG